MRIGYACLAIGVPGSKMRTCRLSAATPGHLIELIGQNLDALEVLIDYNIRNGIRLFRLSSDIIPFGSTVAADTGWEIAFADKLKRIGSKILESGMRVSMHPGQYTVLNSPDSGVVSRAADDLRYHAAFLDALGVDASNKLILHLGGVYGDKAAAQSRFLENYGNLPQTVKRRLVLENDDSLYTISDILETAEQAGIPVVYDNLHNAINPAEPGTSDACWIARSALTWQEADGPQKIHYSQQDPEKRPGAHSGTIDPEIFLEFIRLLPSQAIDIMLEVNDKNISALKCINCAKNRGMERLEQEWARYKYLVLEHSASHYKQIRQLLRDKQAYPAREMYRLIENALSQPIKAGSAVNAVQHVWGYFKTQANATEKKRFDKLLLAFTEGAGSLQTLKKHLLSLAVRYRQEYLLTSYYFYIT